MTVREIYDFIDRIAPFENQDEFDNSGLLAGDFDRQVKSICVCLDVTADVVRAAKEKSADLIISHHPLIFRPIHALLTDNPLYGIVESGMSYIAAHTNFDMADCGLSDIMLERLALKKSTKVLRIINQNGSGYGKIVTLDTPVTAESLALSCKEAFNCFSVRYTDGGKEISRIAVCSGAGSDELMSAAREGCDAYITGDVKHNCFVAAKKYGITLIDAGHFNTEITFCDALIGMFNSEFGGDIEIFAVNDSFLSYV